MIFKKSFIIAIAILLSAGDALAAIRYRYEEGRWIREDGASKKVVTLSGDDVKRLTVPEREAVLNYLFSPDGVALLRSDPGFVSNVYPLMERILRFPSTSVEPKNQSGPPSPQERYHQRALQIATESADHPLSNRLLSLVADSGVTPDLRLNAVRALAPRLDRARYREYVKSTLGSISHGHVELGLYVVARRLGWGLEDLSSLLPSNEMRSPNDARILEKRLRQLREQLFRMRPPSHRDRQAERFSPLEAAAAEYIVGLAKHGRISPQIREGVLEVARVLAYRLPPRRHPELQRLARSSLQTPATPDRRRVVSPLKSPYPPAPRFELSLNLPTLDRREPKTQLPALIEELHDLRPDGRDTAWTVLQRNERDLFGEYLNPGRANALLEWLYSRVVRNAALDADMSPETSSRYERTREVLQRRFVEEAINHPRPGITEVRIMIASKDPNGIPEESSAPRRFLVPLDDGAVGVVEVVKERTKKGDLKKYIVGDVDRFPTLRRALQNSLDIASVTAQRIGEQNEIPYVVLILRRDPERTGYLHFYPFAQGEGEYYVLQPDGTMSEPIDRASKAFDLLIPAVKGHPRQVEFPVSDERFLRFCSDLQDVARTARPFQTFREGSIRGAALQNLYRAHRLMEDGDIPWRNSTPVGNSSRSETAARILEISGKVALYDAANLPISDVDMVLGRLRSEIDKILAFSAEDSAHAKTHEAFLHQGQLNVREMERIVSSSSRASSASTLHSVRAHLVAYSGAHNLLLSLRPSREPNIPSTVELPPRRPPRLSSQGVGHRTAIEPEEGVGWRELERLAEKLGGRIMVVPKGDAHLGGEKGDLPAWVFTSTSSRDTQRPGWDLFWPEGRPRYTHEVSQEISHPHMILIAESWVSPNPDEARKVVGNLLYSSFLRRHRARSQTEEQDRRYAQLRLMRSKKELWTVEIANELYDRRSGAHLTVADLEYLREQSEARMQRSTVQEAFFEHVDAEHRPTPIDHVIQHALREGEPISALEALQREIDASDPQRLSDLAKRVNRLMRWEVDRNGVPTFKVLRFAAALRELSIEPDQKFPVEFEEAFDKHWVDTLRKVDSRHSSVAALAENSIVTFLSSISPEDRANHVGTLVRESERMRKADDIFGSWVLRYPSPTAEVVGATYLALIAHLSPNEARSLMPREVDPEQVTKRNERLQHVFMKIDQRVTRVLDVQGKIEDPSLQLALVAVTGALLAEEGPSLDPNARKGLISNLRWIADPSETLLTPDTSIRTLLRSSNASFPTWRLLQTLNEMTGLPRAGTSSAHMPSEDLPPLEVRMEAIRAFLRWGDIQVLQRISSSGDQALVEELPLLLEFAETVQGQRHDLETWQSFVFRLVGNVARTTSLTPEDRARFVSEMSGIARRHPKLRIAIVNAVTGLSSEDIPPVIREVSAKILEDITRWPTSPTVTAAEKLELQLAAAQARRGLEGRKSPQGVPTPDVSHLSSDSSDHRPFGFVGAGTAARAELRFENRAREAQIPSTTRALIQWARQAGIEVIEVNDPNDKRLIVDGKKMPMTVNMKLQWFVLKNLPHSSATDAAALHEVAHLLAFQILARERGESFVSALQRAYDRSHGLKDRNNGAVQAVRQLEVEAARAAREVARRFDGRSIPSVDRLVEALREATRERLVRANMRGALDQFAESIVPTKSVSIETLLTEAEGMSRGEIATPQGSAKLSGITQSIANISNRLSESEKFQTIVRMGNAIARWDQQIAHKNYHTSRDRSMGGRFAVGQASEGGRLFVAQQINFFVDLIRKKSTFDETVHLLAKFPQEVGRNLITSIGGGAAGGVYEMVTEVLERRLWKEAGRVVTAHAGSLAGHSSETPRGLNLKLLVRMQVVSVVAMVIDEILFGQGVGPGFGERLFVRVGGVLGAGLVVKTGFRGALAGARVIYRVSQAARVGAVGLSAASAGASVGLIAGGPVGWTVLAVMLVLELRLAPYISQGIEFARLQRNIEVPLSEAMHELQRQITAPLEGEIPLGGSGKVLELAGRYLTDIAGREASQIEAERALELAALQSRYRSYFEEISPGFLMVRPPFRGSGDAWWVSFQDEMNRGAASYIERIREPEAEFHEVLRNGSFQALAARLKPFLIQSDTLLNCNVSDPECTMTSLERVAEASNDVSSFFLAEKDRASGDSSSTLDRLLSHGQNGIRPVLVALPAIEPESLLWALVLFALQQQSDLGRSFRWALAQWITQMADLLEEPSIEENPEPDIPPGQVQPLLVYGENKTPEDKHRPYLEKTATLVWPLGRLVPQLWNNDTSGVEMRSLVTPFLLRQALLAAGLKNRPKEILELFFERGMREASLELIPHRRNGTVATWEAQLRWRNQSWSRMIEISREEIFHLYPSKPPRADELPSGYSTSGAIVRIVQQLVPPRRGTLALAARVDEDYVPRSVTDAIAALVSTALRETQVPWYKSGVLSSGGPSSPR